LQNCFLKNWGIRRRRNGITLPKFEEVAKKGIRIWVPRIKELVKWKNC